MFITLSTAPLLSLSLSRVCLYLSFFIASVGTVLHCTFYVLLLSFVYKWFKSFVASTSSFKRPGVEPNHLQRKRGSLDTTTPRPLLTTSHFWFKPPIFVTFLRLSERLNNVLFVISHSLFLALHIYLNVPTSGWQSKYYHWLLVVFIPQTSMRLLYLQLKRPNGPWKSQMSCREECSLSIHFAQ